MTSPTGDTIRSQTAGCWSHRIAPSDPGSTLYIVANIAHRNIEANLFCRGAQEPAAVNKLPEYDPKVGGLRD